MEFWKMQGLGNDFILTDDRQEELTQPPQLARQVCQRHFGVGADGLILMQYSARAHFRMRVYNPDGSEAEMCGNGIRCFARFVWEMGLDPPEQLEVETLAGIIRPRLLLDGDRLRAVAVDMGEPILEPSLVPVAHQGKDALVDYPLEAGGQIYRLTVVSMGNPHCIIPVDNVAAVDLESVGPLLEEHPFFPARTNVEFLEFLSPGELKVRVWERGAGVTLACGSGACACAVAGVLLGSSEREATVHLPGGPLHIQWSPQDNRITMTGPAETVFHGTYPSAGE